MKYLKMAYYGMYMALVRLKGIKRTFIEKTKGERAAWEYGQQVFLKWSEFTIKVIGMDIEIIGKENIPEGTCVFMGNHQSILDIPVLRCTAGREIDFVAKKELVKTPVIGYWITHLKCVALDRENVREGIKAINEAIRNIKEGYSMLVFPEGTRSKDGKIGEFKKGSLKLATKAKVPIVPFSIKGTSACFEDSKEFLPGKVTIVFNKAIDTSNFTKDEENELNDKIYNIIRKSFNGK